MEDGNRDNFQLPAPPPPLQTRDNAMDRPGTPTEAFMSPQQTPQGSPSKHHQPPGAFDLPHVFENAMRLLPTMGSPSKTKPATPTLPNKLQLGDYSAPDSPSHAPGSPTRKSNQENTPLSGRPGLQKESSYLTHAAQSRQEPYRTREEGQQSTRYINGPQRLSPEELEKARKPAVKRLANVTQLCKVWIKPSRASANGICRLPRLLLRSAHLRAQSPEPSVSVQGPEPSTARYTRRGIQRCPYTISWTRARQPPQATYSVTAG
ncbi:kinase-like protein [Alternaria alternata]|nr:kinase-like protein [Alternaria alternata]